MYNILVSFLGVKRHSLIRVAIINLNIIIIIIIDACASKPTIRIIIKFGFNHTKKVLATFFDF